MSWLNFFLNYVLAYVATFCLIGTSIKFITNRISKKSKLNNFLKKVHSPFGIILIISGTIHGIYSGSNIFSLNLGTLIIVLSILLGFSFYLRKLFPKKIKWITIHRLLTLAIITVLVLHIVDKGGITILNRIAWINKTNISQSIYDNPTNKDLSTNLDSTTSSINEFNNTLGSDLVLKDGTYTGTADGYGPNLTVSITISNNKINNISIISHNEDGVKHYGRAINTIPYEIVASQNLYVDTVSGATFTSIGIINSTRDALTKAIISGTLPNSLSLPY